MKRLLPIRFFGSFASGFAAAGIAGAIVAAIIALAQVGRGMLPPSGD